MPVLNRLPKKKRKNNLNNEDYKNRQDIYQSKNWKDLRLAQLQNEPLCFLCLENDIITAAEDVHHIDSFTAYKGNERLSVAYDPNNLVSLCKVCHNKIHHDLEFKTKFTPALNNKKLSLYSSQYYV